MNRNIQTTGRLNRTASWIGSVWLSGIIIAQAAVPGISQEYDGGHITNITGDITYLAPPPSSVELWMLESDTNLFVFTEQRGLVLTSDLPVNISEPGDYFPEDTPDSVRTYENLNPGVIPAGTIVDCYYFHFDNETYTDTLSVENYFGCIGQKRVSGTITFKNPVLGMIIRGYNLNESNPIVGIDTVEYDTDLSRSFPGINIVDGCHSDHFIISEDRRTLHLIDHTDIHHDNYRVIVQADIPTRVVGTRGAGFRGNRSEMLAVYSINGRLLATGESTKRIPQQNGVYLVKHQNAASLHIQKR